MPSNWKDFNINELRNEYTSKFTYSMHPNELTIDNMIHILKKKLDDIYKLLIVANFRTKETRSWLLNNDAILCIYSFG